MNTSSFLVYFFRSSIKFISLWATRYADHDCIVSISRTQFDVCRFNFQRPLCRQYTTHCSLSALGVFLALCLLRTKDYAHRNIWSHPLLQKQLHQLSKVGQHSKLMNVRLGRKQGEECKCEFGEVINRKEVCDIKRCAIANFFLLKWHSQTSLYSLWWEI